MQKNENFNIIDELTGLYNRRYLFLRLDEEIKRAKRKDGVFSLFLLDLDYFKMVNDSFGHIRGDEVLKEFGTLLKSALRDSDLAFRYGGDEFVVILPDTEREHAKRAAERIIERVKNYTFSGEPPVNLSVSIGISVFPYDGVTAESIFKVADRRLYEAKRKGRSRAVHISEVLTERSPYISFNELRLIGRDYHIDQIKKFLGLLSEEQGGFLFIKGDRGCGKTRLLREITKIAELTGYRSIYIKAMKHVEGLPFNTVKDILKKIYSVYGPDVFFQIPEAYQLEIYKLLPEIFTYKPEFETKFLTSSPYRLFRAILIIFENIARAGGILIMVDDAHWMDRKSVEFFQYAASNLQSMQIIFIFSYISYKTREIEELLKFILSLENFLELEVLPLSPKEVESLLWEALRERPPDDFVNWVYEKTGGKPAYIAILVKALIQQNVLVWEGGWRFGDYTTIKIPKELSSALIYEYTKRPKETVKVLELCSVIGDSFSADFIASLLDINLGAVLDVMDELVREGLLEEREEYLHYRFANRMIRDAIYELISDDRRKRLHYLVASKLEEMFWGHKDISPKTVAFHYMQADMKKKAIPFLELSVQTSMENYAYNDAINTIHELLEILEDSRDYSRLSALYYKLGICYKHVNLFKEAKKAFERSLQLGKEISDQLMAARLYKEIAGICDELGMDDEMLFNAERAISIASTINAREELLEAMNLKAIYYGDKEKNYVEAILTLESAIEMAEEERDNKVLPKLYANYGKYEFMLSHYDRSKMYFERALDLAVSLGDKRLESVILLNYASVVFWMEGLESARKYYERAREIAQMYTFQRILPYIYSNLSVIYIHMGEYSLAYELLERTYNLYRQMDRMERAYFYLARMGSVKVYMGNLEEGRRILEKVIQDSYKNKYLDAMAEAKLRLFILTSWEANIEKGLELVDELKKLKNIRKRDLNLNLFSFYVEYSKQPLEYEKDILKLMNECKRTKDIYSLSQAVTTVAKMYYKAGRKKDALVHLRDVINLTFARGFYRYFLETSLFYLLIENNIKEIENVYSLVRKLEEKLSARHRLMFSLANAHVNIVQGNFEGVEENLGAIIEQIQRSGFRVLLPYAYRIMAELHDARGDEAKSKDYMNKAETFFVLGN